MKNKSQIILNFRQCDKKIFDAVLDGRKKVETRTASAKFQDLKTNNTVVLKCGQEKVAKKIKTIKYVSGIDELLEHYKVADINPFIKNKKELEEMYFSFPNYREKIEKYGLVAIEFNENLDKKLVHDTTKRVFDEYGDVIRKLN